MRLTHVQALSRDPHAVTQPGCWWMVQGAFLHVRAAEGKQLLSPTTECGRPRLLIGFLEPAFKVFSSIPQLFLRFHSLCLTAEQSNSSLLRAVLVTKKHKGEQDTVPGQRRSQPGRSGRQIQLWMRSSVVVAQHILKSHQDQNCLPNPLEWPHQNVQNLRLPLNEDPRLTCLMKWSDFTSIWCDNTRVLYFIEKE